MLFLITGVSQTPVYADTSIFAQSEYTVDSVDELFTLDFNEGVTVTKVTSSDTTIVSVDDIYSSFVYLRSKGIGTATITATDQSGNQDTCKVTVLPEPLQLDLEELQLTRYEEGDDIISVHSDTNKIKSVVSSDKTVAKVTLDGKYVFYITPVSGGEAVITVTDVYNQTVTIPVTITQKYIDEMKYLEDMKYALETVYYGDRRLEFELPFNGAKISVEMNGETYTTSSAVFEGMYDYYIKIPLLPAGTQYSYTIKKGEAEYSSKGKINVGSLYARGFFGYISKSSYVYSGKACKPAVSVYYEYFGLTDYAEKKLTKGTDYKVSYQNNVNVGKATVTATGIGNYAKATTISFTIVPKGTSLKTVTAGTKSFKAKWAKQSAKMSKTRITGYQIRYSKESSMSGAKKVKAVGYAKTSKTIKGLSAKTKYYVQVRTYKVVNGKPYYSKWSTKKIVKTK